MVGLTWRARWCSWAHGWTCHLTRVGAAGGACPSTWLVEVGTIALWRCLKGPKVAVYTAARSKKTTASPLWLSRAPTPRRPPLRRRLAQAMRPPCSLLYSPPLAHNHPSGRCHVFELGTVTPPSSLAGIARVARAAGGWLGCLSYMLTLANGAGHLGQDWIRHGNHCGWTALDCAAQGADTGGQLAAVAALLAAGADSYSSSKVSRTLAPVPRHHHSIIPASHPLTRVWSAAPHPLHRDMRDCQR